MTKLLFTLLTTLFINNPLLCMKRPRTETSEEQTSKKICSLDPSKQYLPTDIIISTFIESFKTGVNNSKTIQNNIHNVSLVNKDFYHQVNLPHNIREIINNAGHRLCRVFLANTLTLPAVKNYVQQSENLHTKINLLTHDQIKKLVCAGADVNYCCCLDVSKYSYPVLMHTRNDYDKTALLLELGADPDMSNGHENVPTPFQYALVTEDINLIKLFLAHKPRLKYLKTAVQTKNDEIITLILEDKNISIPELNEALETIIRKTFNLSHARLLLDAGADPTLALKSFSFRQDRILRFHKLLHILDRFTLDMIDLLCTYGAYNDVLYQDLRINRAPQQLIDSLEKGRRAFLEKIKRSTL